MIYHRMHDHNIGPRHIYNIAVRGAAVLGKDSNFNLNEKAHNIIWIKANLSIDLVEKIHDELRREYAKNSSGRAFLRGRPFGAKNKNKSREIDALTDALGPQVSDVQTSVPQIAPPQHQDMSKYCLQQTHQDAMENIAVQLGKLAHDDTKLSAHIIALQEKVSTIVDHRPTIVELKRIDLPAVNLGVQHKSFPKLLRACSAQLRGGAHLNVWIYGPAGTGKSTATENVSKALGIDFFGNGKISYAHELLGHMHGGTYITTQFRDAFEKGGVYCADEVDGWMPDALIALNGALANGHCAFPDKMVKRHSNFVFIGAANTTGLGGTLEYVSRFKQDAAFNDRCIYIEWPLDEALEDSICANKEWLGIVRHVRSQVTKYKISGHLVTPRASIYGEALLAAGMDLDDVKIAVLKKGMTDGNWAQIWSA